MRFTESDSIEIFGAREHNLKNIDLKIPRYKLVVFTGLSGSGKSSLAFDTIFAEGQRRYIETFSSYARQFLGGLERPDVDKIEGLSPVISIEQKTVSKSPRSTVGTITELYDFFRLLFARVSTAVSYNTGEKMIKYSDEQIVQLIIDQFDNQKLVILSPKIKGRKGHYRELFEQISKLGFNKVRIDGELTDITAGMRLDRYKIHDIEIVIDRIKVAPEEQKRISDSVQQALKHGSNSLILFNPETKVEKYLSRSLMCPSTGISYPEPEPSLFSFNSPYGACKKCNGLGEISEIDESKMIPNKKKSIQQGGIVPLGEIKSNWLFERLDKMLHSKGFLLTTPIEDLPEELIAEILYGSEESPNDFEGISNFILRHYEENPSSPVKRWAESFMNTIECPECLGSRLKKESLYFKIDGKHIGELSRMDFSELKVWLNHVNSTFNNKEQIIAKEILTEINNRLGFILDVGLDYLTLHRSAKSLSGGEGQRIRLATQIGSELVNVLYVLDEPSIGLHQRDNSRLIESLCKLRDTGNSLIVVEHDREMIEAADFVVDIGPGAGINGGMIVNAGPYSELKEANSLTTQYLHGIRKIEIPKKRRKGNGLFLKLKNATGNNLKSVNLEIPLGTLTAITGVSGSGKSSLINDTLYPILNNYYFHGVKRILPYGKIEGLEHLDKVIEIDQTPIGRTPRSNPATYTNMFNEIRSLYASLPEAQIRGYKPGRFSFNVKGGRCETCGGGGVKVIEMNFLPDVLVECETCHGKRYNRETLEIRFKGKSISDVLDMNISEATTFFSAIPKIHRILATLESVGMGYIKLGQPSTTLSGGEAQRIKLATELAKKSTGKTIYILDEPSTGLHFEDIRMLLDVLQRLVNEGNTVVVIEHNLDIIKVADYVIDMGLEGGKRGGDIIAKGTPEEIVKKYINLSYTAKYLKKELN